MLPLQCSVLFLQSNGIELLKKDGWVIAFMLSQDHVAEALGAVVMCRGDVHHSLGHVGYCCWLSVSMVRDKCILIASLGTSVK